MIRRDTSRFISPDALLFVALATIWGLSFVAIEVGLETVPPLFFAAIRYALAGVLVLAYAAMTTDRIRPHGLTEWLNVAVVGGLLVAGYHALLYIGQTFVSGPVAAVVVSLSPILTAVFAAALLEDTLELTAVGGFLLGLVGVAVVADLDLSNLLGADATGIAVLFGAAATFAFGAVLSTPLRTTLADVSMQAWAMLFGAGILVGASLARGEPITTVTWTPTAALALAYLTVFSGVIGFLLYFALHGRIGPSETNLVGYFQPIVAALAGWAVFGQAVTPETVVGFLAIFTGFVMIERKLVRQTIGPVSFHPDSLRYRLRKRFPRLLGRRGGRSVRVKLGTDAVYDDETAGADYGHDAD
ncbi:MAG: DMT family transporter [Halobellus sp.]|uniref:DMT family transporter n=1 Tax=Halobellus sp. TaxID=1979212 RepID=UPI0035D4AF59